MAVNSIKKIRINGKVYDFCPDWDNILNKPDFSNITAENDVYVGKLENGQFKSEGYFLTPATNKLYIDVESDPDGAATMYIYKDSQFVQIFKDTAIANKEIKEIHKEMDTLKTNTQTQDLGEAIEKVANQVVDYRIVWN